MGMSIQAASLLSLFVESLLYGCFSSAFIACCGIMYGRYHDSPPTRVHNIRLLVILALMFILSTIHVGTSMWRILAAFRNRNTSEFLDKLTNTQYVIRITIYGIQTHIGDAFIIYRLYIVWNRSKITCLPVVILFVVNFAAGLGCLIPNNSNSPLHSPWGITFFWLTLSINLYATVLIAARLWSLHRQITSAGIPSLALTAATVIIESCAAYSFSLVLLIAFSMKGTAAQDIMLDSMSPIMGIIFSIVIFRLALGVSNDGATLSTTKEAKMSRLVFQRSSPDHNDFACEEASGTISDRANDFPINSDHTNTHI